MSSPSRAKWVNVRRIQGEIRMGKAHFNTRAAAIRAARATKDVVYRIRFKIRRG